VADAALIIEGQCEEDISSVADLLLLNLQPHDVVVGISASGTAFFVRSALAFAQTKKCRTIFVHEAEIADSVDLSIRLHSGPEKIRGSTRLKAGTATKKALNILSTTAMILLGKVREGEMIDLQCTNEKLRARAVRILSRLSGKSPVEGLELLKDNDYQLRSALEALEK
jgi:N-acetylmuramic acid 6-phosphate (MurNAc-6-P) etherase